MKLYLVAMRSLALIAFLALQLSVFTCGFNIHVHAAGVDTAHIAEHIHDDSADHEQNSHDHGCHVHASHTFTTFDLDQIGDMPALSSVHCFLLPEPYLKNLSFLIEYPPKIRLS
jgi:hypothetical protein